MNNIYIYLQLFIVVMLMAACTKETVDDNTTDEPTNSSSRQMSLVATQEHSSLSTRASLSEVSETFTNVWQNNDQLMVYDNSDNNTFSLEQGSNTSTGTFKGKTSYSTDVNYTALYPFAIGTITAEGMASVTFPSNQTATVNGYDSNAMIMIGKGKFVGNDKILTISMKNTVALVQVTPNFDCKSIIITSPDSKIAGTGTISYASSEPILTITETRSNSNTITLQGTINQGNTYYIVVPAVTLSANWTISFEDSNNVLKTRRTDKSITFNRNTITNLGTFYADALYWE